MWTADGSGVCSAASAAGPFGCTSTLQDFGSLTAVTGQPGVLVLATGSDVRRSVDGGATWSLPPGFLPRDLATGDPTTPGRVYAVGSGSRLMQSVDGGATWTTNGQDPSCEPSRIADHAPGLLADPSAAGRLYSRGTGTALCRSVDGGATWTAAVLAGGRRSARRRPAARPGHRGDREWRARRRHPRGPPPVDRRRRDVGGRAGAGQRAIGPVAAAGSTVYAGTLRRGVFAATTTASPGGPPARGCRPCRSARRHSC